MISRSVFHRSAAIVAFAVALPAIGAVLKTDAAKSNVSAVFKQMNVPVEGKFKKFSAQIDFNAAKPEASTARLEVDIPSFDIGDADINKEAQKKDWFNGAQFPTATFVSSALKPTGNGKLDVSGKLSIKGKTSDVSFPLTVKKEGNYQVFEGALPIKRLAFNIGDGAWKDTSMVADEVVIKFRVLAAQ